MKVNPDFWIDTAERQPILGGSEMQVRRLLVIHFTSGATGQSSIDGWKKANDGVLAHFMIERDGRLIQCRGLNRTCGHVGGQGKSRWKDPHTGKGYDGLNSCAIGIELANAGSDGPMQWVKRNGFTTAPAKHRNGGPVKEWETFPQAQLATCFQLSKVLVARFNLDDLTGHDCVSPERRDDPGPLFPMADLRAHTGFAGLPVVWEKGKV